MKSWILDYATPTRLTTSSVVAPTGYIREVLVIKKGVDSAIEILTSKQSVDPSMAVNGLFDAGMTRVAFKTAEDLDLTNLDLVGQYFTIVVEGFDELELEAKDLGTFDGVFVFESNTLTPSVVKNTMEVYSQNVNGYTAGYIIGLLLTGAEWKNLQYTSTNKNVYFIEDLGTANGLYNNYGTAFGKDDFQGVRLVSAFIGGEGISKPYILEEIKVLTQVSNLKMLAKEVKWTKLDAQNVQAVNTNFINDNYVQTNLVSSFTYKVSLGSSTKEFNSKLDIVVPMPVWKINMEVSA